MHQFWMTASAAIVVGFLKQLSAYIETKRQPKMNPNSAVEVAAWLRAQLTAEEQAELAARGQ